MKNRYGKKLKKSNQDILALLPANQTLRFIMALELKKLYKKGNRVLDLGCGEGNSARPLLVHTKANLDLLDVSPEMIRSCRKNLAEFKKRTRYICKDATKCLERSRNYDFILSSWTIHNFKKSERKRLLSLIYKKLSVGGYFILLDKIYPAKGGNNLLDIQLQRYRYLPRQACKKISDHEKTDHTDKYRLDEKLFINELKRIGFSKITIADRVEREIILVTKK